MTALFDRSRIEAAVLEIIRAIGDDPDRPELLDTPRRVAESYAEMFSGVGVDVDGLVSDAVVPAGEGERGELVIIRNIQFRSVCEHHMLPFLGVAHVAYVPETEIIGLGRVPQIIDALASRPMLQERLGEDVAEALQKGVSPAGVLVVVDAVHGCVTSRGSRQIRSSTVTVASRGVLVDPVRRSEALTLIRWGEDDLSLGGGTVMEAGSL